MGDTRLDAALLSPWIEVGFSKSPGPGGQNVNKVSTRVTLLFDLSSCTALTNTEKSRVRRRLANRITRDDRVRIVCHRERTQAKNRAAAFARLIELVSEAIRVPKPRRSTRPTAGSKKRRLETKRKHGRVKKERRAKLDVD